MRLIKRIVWSLLPLFLLLLSGEVIVRLRYFFYHKHDWNYVTMPFRVQDIQGLDHAFFKQPDDVLFAKKPAAPTAPASGAGPAPAAAQPAAEPQPSSAQMNFKWHRPCQDREVFSAHYNKPMPYTWDANCFRGDSVGTTRINLKAIREVQGFLGFKTMGAGGFFKSISSGLSSPGRKSR